MSETFESQGDKSSQRDLYDEARAKGTTPERLQAQRAQEDPLPQANAQQSAAAPGQLRPGALQDGYQVTEGREYERANPVPEQTEGYDPAQSGVRSAPNTPGAPANTPGREEGTAWSEQMQMGRTDTPERKNPAE